MIAIGAGEFIDPGSSVETSTVYVHRFVDGPHMGEVTILDRRAGAIFCLDGSYDVDIVPVAEYKRTIDLEGIKVEIPVFVYHARLRG